jgi:putative tryptophan/tyrosine transport system substrate-binding protein
MQVKRRDFITLLGGAAVAWPLAARAQQPAMLVLGFLHSGSPEQNVERLAAFRKGLAEAGFVEGQNVVIEFRWAMGRNDTLPDMVADLIRRRVAVIATPLSTPAAIAAKTATTSIPIVFAVASDPVALGLVASLNRPGGNSTGIATLNAELAAKRLGLLRDLVPGASRYAALVNPTNPALSHVIARDVEAAAASLGLQIEILHAGTDREIESAFADLAQKPGSVLLVGTDAYFYVHRILLATLAARHAVPAIYDGNGYAQAGALISYGSDTLNICELAGAYTARILKGEKPANLPVMQPTKFEMVINLKTAKALGLEIPPTLLALADEVIE